MIEIIFPTHEAAFEDWAFRALVAARIKWATSRGFRYLKSHLTLGGYATDTRTEQWVLTVTLS